MTSLVRGCVPIVVCAGLALAGCKKKSTAPSNVGDASESGIAEPGVAEGEGLGFRITKVYASQRATDVPPFHADGGEQTYFDATTRGGASFTFGFTEPQKSNRPMAFGEVVLAAPSPAEGQKLVSELARRFHGTDPPARLAVTTVAPKPFSAVFLATDAKREGAGFSGSGGGYYATKLFLQRRGIEAEVFFNFSLKTKTGEFAEKDSDYANDMVAFFASELRDAPPPERDPKTEPRLSTTGPKITWGRQIAGVPDRMSQEGDRFVVTRKTPEGRTTLVSVSLEKDGDERELLSVAHHLSSWMCAESTCVAVDQTPKDPPQISSDDPGALLVFENTQGHRTQRELKGPWGGQPFLEEHSLSSDGRLIAMGVAAAADVRSRKRLLYIVESSGAVRGPVDLGEESWRIESFSPTKLTIERGKIFSRDAEATLVDVDPVTLAVASPRPSPKTPADGLSPDKKLRVTCSEDGGTITVSNADGSAPRAFEVFEEDRRSVKDDCPPWVSPRYLEYPWGFIDVTTMKLSRAFAASEEPGRIEYDRAFKHAVRFKPTLQIGTVTAPR